MASFTSHLSDDSMVSFHTDTRGVTMTRAKLPRAEGLFKVSDSPGPAAYYDPRSAFQSPAMKSGIKFSLAKKPAGLFDVPASRVCPGPGAYNQSSSRTLGVAEFKHLRTPGAIVSPSGKVATPRTHRSGQGGSPRAQSAAKRSSPERRQGQATQENASSSSVSSSSSSVHADSSSSGSSSTVGPHPRAAKAASSQYPTAASRRQASTALAAAATRSSVDGGGVVFVGGVRTSAGHVDSQLSDISNLSADYSSAPVRLPGGGAFGSQQAPAPKGGGRSGGGGSGSAGRSGVGAVPKVQPQDVGIDPAVLNPALFNKLRLKLLAATFNGLPKSRRGKGGKNKSSLVNGGGEAGFPSEHSGRVKLFMKSDKNHDGVLDVAEVQSLIRKVLKFSPEELSNAQIRAVFSALDTRRANCLDYDQLFALIGREKPNGGGGGASASSMPSTVRAPHTAKPPLPQHQQHTPRQQLQHNQQPATSSALFGSAFVDQRTTTTNPVATTGTSDTGLLAPAVDESAAPTEAIAEMLSDVQRLHGDFDNQLQELGQISAVLDKLLGTMAP
mmetsp:Transcript_2694/g.5644  ORF Transcript_2694/g.5644 Transcript_2694/m.5644 type:complete len:556 (+) Transcript_2694:89-1756(+)